MRFIVLCVAALTLGRVAACSGNAKGDSNTRAVARIAAIITADLSDDEKVSQIHHVLSEEKLKARIEAEGRAAVEADLTSKSRRSPIRGICLFDSLQDSDTSDARKVLELLEKVQVRSATMALAIARKGTTVKDSFAREVVTDLFRIAVNVPGFATKGDLIWRVQNTTAPPVSIRTVPTTGVTGETWVNANTGRAANSWPASN